MPCKMTQSFCTMTKIFLYLCVCAMVFHKPEVQAYAYNFGAQFGLLTATMSGDPTEASQIKTKSASIATCECGKPSDALVSMRIVGGRRAVPHSFPWTVAIIKHERMHCGGALITDQHVLSAGHCFKWDDFKTMVALIGLDNLDVLTDVDIRNISEVVIHEHFTSTAVRDENDIAVATLNKPVEFSSKIVPICLPLPGQDYTDLLATIVGWGRIGFEKSSSRVLMRANLRIQSDEECQKSKLAEHIKPTMMCAYSKGKDGCQGDSGGPLVIFEPSGRYVQAGIISWGIGCADPRYPGVYTNVSYYVDWIRKHSQEGGKCS